MTGRPFGDDRFMKKLERLFGRRLPVCRQAGGRYHGEGRAKIKTVAVPILFGTMF
ncbi:MAG: hypothetical protein ACE5KZ_03950 [Candidatus Scalinduaceae bacterium]